MEVLVALIVILVLGAVVLLVSAPLRTAPLAGGGSDRRDELEAAKEAKYREIRDAELDFRMGKLSEADYREQDRDLRAEAMAILRALDDQGPLGG